MVGISSSWNEKKTKENKRGEKYQDLLDKVSCYPVCKIINDTGPQ